MPDHRLVDDLLPVYDVSDAVAVTVAADVAPTWDALLAADLIQLGKRRPLVGLLGAVRALPEIVSALVPGRRPAKPPERLTLRDMTSLHMADGGWVLLGEGHDELALGLVGTFWRPVIRYSEVPDAAAFRAFARPGYAKTVYALWADELEPGRSQLTAVMRTATTDPGARRWFWRYWNLGVGSGAHVLARGLLEEARTAAERAQPPPRRGEAPDR